MNNINQITYITLTAQEFIDAWDGGYKGVKKEDAKGYWDGGLDNFNKRPVIVFEKIEVFKTIFLEGRQLTTDIVIKNSNLMDFVLDNSNIESVTINSSNFKNIALQNNSKIAKIQILHSQTGDLRVYNSTTGSWHIENSIIGFFQCYYSTTKTITIRYSYADWFSVKNNSTIKSVDIDHSTTGLFSVEDSIIDWYKAESVITGGIDLGANTIIKEQIEFGQSKIWKITVKSKELRKINILDSFCQCIEWRQDSFCMFSMDNCQVETFLFVQTCVPKDSVFQISNTEVNLFKCSQFVNTAWLIISGLKAMNTYDHFVENTGLIQYKNNEYEFEQVTKRSFLIFVNSDLGKTSFIDCRLNLFDKFVYANTKMLEVFLAGTILPTKIDSPQNGFSIDRTDKQWVFNSKVLRLINERDEKVTTIYFNQTEQERLAFSQFKKISENRGDNVQATEFLALEMDAYARVIANDSSKWGERFNLWLNRISSNWGNDWVRAVLVTLGINTFLFLSYCLSLGYDVFGTSPLHFLSYSFEFLNPLRKTDFLEKITINRANIGLDDLARTIDYSSRIIVAYFTYQSIQAFRRFGRKS
jgi:hypothetical protein